MNYSLELLGSLSNAVIIGEYVISKISVAVHSQSCPSPARSDVRSASERSALPETLRAKAAVNPHNFFGELKPPNVY
jgi:hypothetical protein